MYIYYKPSICIDGLYMFISPMVNLGIPWILWLAPHLGNLR